MTFSEIRKELWKRRCLSDVAVGETVLRLSIDVHKAKKEQIVIEFLGDKLACIDDIIKNESGRFLKVEERYIDIQYENRTIVVQYKGTRCTENGDPFKRDRTIARTDVFDLTK